MKIEADSPEAYLDALPPDRRAAMEKLRQVILENLPDRFQETMSYGMIGYVVPHSLYPEGYHVNPKLPLPFLNIASQKNFIALYHMGMYSDKALMNWFTDQYSLHCNSKPDMGKSCVRFKKIDQIPFALIGDLIRKMSVEDWIGLYQGLIRNK